MSNSKIGMKLVLLNSAYSLIFVDYVRQRNENVVNYLGAREFQLLMHKVTDSIFSSQSVMFDLLVME